MLCLAVFSSSAVRKHPCHRGSRHLVSECRMIIMIHRTSFSVVGRVGCATSATVRGGSRVIVDLNQPTCVPSTAFKISRFAPSLPEISHLLPGLAPFLAPSSSSPQNDRSVLVIPLIPPSITCVIVYSTERDSRFPHLHWRACHRSSSPQTPERTIPSKFLPPESLSGVLAICRLGVVEQSIGN